MIFDTLYDHVIDRLTKDLPDHLVYHDVLHTQYVIEKSIFLADKEGVTGYDLTLLKIAALYHDTGFLINGKEHERLSCELVSQDLKSSEFTQSDMDKIHGMIMATKIPQNPQNLLENILADADLEYLGTDLFEPVSEKLYLELLHGNPAFTREEWDRLQVKFISAHQYHTDYCKEHREHIKQANLEYVKIRLADCSEE